MTQLATTPSIKPSALAVMAGRFNVEPAKLLSTLKNTVFKGASDDELLALVVVANEYGLSPLTKEIYAFPAKGGGIVPVVSIDGWINRMNSNPQFDGIEFEDTTDEATGKPVSTTAIVWRKDRTRPVKITEYFAECKRNTEPWNTMPHRMLRHKALCQAVRVAFGFSGVYDEDEAARIAALPSAMPVVNVVPKSDAEGLRAAQEQVEAFVDKKNAEVVVAKAKARAKKEPEPVTLQPGEEHPPAASAPSDRDRFAIMLEESGYNEAQALKALRAMTLIGNDIVALKDVDYATILEVLKSWDVVFIPTLAKLFPA